MAKFSIFRDDDDEDEEFSVRSPKRRRTSENPSISQSTQNDDEIGDHHHHHHQPQARSEDDNNNHDDTESVDETTKLGSMPVILSDPDVLDCSICFNPLTVPVFQCDSGHIACSSCCAKLGNKCPSCCGKIGHNRCRAIEKVIESVRVSCCYLRYGCKEMVIYCKKQEHEEICSYAPCSCPFLDCNFRGSPRMLSQHVGKEHADFVVRFRYDSSFPVSVGLDEKCVVLQEERYGILFVLSHGNTVTVRCIDPSLSKGRFAYDVVLHEGDSSIKFQSFTHSVTGQVRAHPSVDYFLIPGYFYDTNGRLKLEVCIWNKESLRTAKSC
ncbi:hypothetical protein Cgig2_003277 [Carnegiea gigantea]|uniref:RING-type E3 ubiquitin transferase n=1 Tax=Carnegiea gigantea TaxID=171969 RepID=A0A9Q1JME2_9CARY|nr:hypothetical protein Cgig2_003277 [Carnegiea gigantea]